MSWSVLFIAAQVVTWRGLAAGGSETARGSGGLGRCAELPPDHWVSPWVAAHLLEVQLPLSDVGQQLLYRVTGRAHEIARGRGSGPVEPVLMATL